MERIMLITYIAALICGVSAAPQKKDLFPNLIQPSALSDLESYNCNSVIESGSCAIECGLNECYQTTSLTGTIFPEDGFCAVFNMSQQFYYGLDWYSVSGRICMSSSSYPQGTGLLFNYKDQNNYEVVYKSSQNSTACDFGYVQNGILYRRDSFDCGTTTADQWHRYTITVYSNKTAEASLSTQDGSLTTSALVATNYPMSTRGGALITNDGSPGKVLQFDEISVRLSTGCDASLCGAGGSCVDVSGSYICQCYLGFTGVHCETALPPVIYFLEFNSSASGFITNLASDGSQTRVTTSGGVQERGLVIDIRSSLLFYTTQGAPEAVWKADLNDIAGTRTRIWTPSYAAYGLGLSATDRVVFADDYSSIVMLSYDGVVIDRLSVTKTYSWGIAVEEIQQILYFTEYNNDRLWKATFSPTSFIGSATIMLQGTAAGQTGNAPAGLMLDGDILYWILYPTGEIRSISVAGSTSTTIVAALASGHNSYYLTKKVDYFYYTRNVGDGGVYRVVAGGTRQKITTGTTFATMGIDVY